MDVLHEDGVDEGSVRWHTLDLKHLTDLEDLLSDNRRVLELLADLFRHVVS